MEHGKSCNHSNCTAANSSVCQTLSEIDWERGLWAAAFNGETNKVKELIDKSKNPRELVNTVDNSGYSPLHYAARSGNVDICKILLQNGAQINAQTRSGKATPLHKAAAAGKQATLEFLIKSGACVDTRDADGQTALHKAVDNKRMDLVDILIDACPSIRDIKDEKGRLAIA